MTNMQLVESLCALVEALSGIVYSLASELEQIKALDDSERRKVSEAMKQCEDILGTESVPYRTEVEGWKP